MIENLEQLLAGTIKKLAIIEPPRHSKTTLGNVMLPAFALGRNPTETIITVSYGSELSETWGRKVRNILSDPAFQQLFPHCQMSPDTSAAYRFSTTAGGEYTATGRGGPITGKGASLLVLDDLIKDAQEANSETTCRSIVEWLQSVAFTRLTPNGRVLAIATRWSERDPMGWILQQNGWTVLHLPAFAESKADPLGREIGEALWPSHYPVEALEQIRADVGSRVFQTLYQGNVSASQGTIFKRDWFQHYQQRPETFTRIVQSWDTAFKTGATNDYSVCATFGESKSGFYLLSLYRAKVEFPELKRQVAQQADFWRPSEIYVEDKASGQSLIQELKLATTYPIIPVKIDRDKETRASAVTGYFESGRVLFPEGAPWLADLEDELASFPGGLHDDCVDAVSQALNRLRDSGGGLGLVDLFKDMFAGKRKLPRSFEEAKNSKPAVEDAKAKSFQTWQGRTRNQPGPPCPACGKTCTTFVGGPPRLHCNDCGAEDGIKPAPAIVDGKCPVDGCNLTMRMVSSAWYCQNHGQLPAAANRLIGATFAELRRGRGARCG
ncbi:MAG TPA: phage terminase large subunit [Candidatus Dormibacteraeota bacterium]|nr:phage terminase large subunit [Candidatus Dormibacteraeota bacterium]